MAKEQNFLNIKYNKLHLKKILLFISIFQFSIILIYYFEKYFWIFELISNFKIYFFYFSILVLLILIFFKNKILIFINFFIFLNYFISISPYFKSYKIQKHKNTLKIFHTNVEKKNKNYNLLLNEIEKLKPEIIILQEIDETWILNISNILKNYPKHKYLTREDAFGIGIFSKIELDNSEIFYSEENFPILKANFIFQNKKINLISFHPTAPKNFKKFQDRIKLLDEVSKISSSLETKIIIGDLNLTPFSYMFEDFLINSNLNYQKEFGLIKTYPSNFSFLAIPIDHCLTSFNLEITNLEKGNSIGSDHFPIICEISLK